MWNHPYEPSVITRPPRSLIRPAIRVERSYTGSWDVTVSGIDEDTGGTYYSDWVTLSGAPRANGWFMLPSFTLEVGSTGAATCYLELGSGDAAFDSGTVLGDLYINGSGDASRAPGSALLVGFSHSRPLTQLRWAVVSDAPVEWTQSATTLYKLT